MKIKCPDCGSTIDIDRLRGEQAFREIIEIYKALPPGDAGLIGEYVECFRTSAHAEMSMKKHLRILKDVVEIVASGRITYARYTYNIDREVALEAMQKTVDTEKRNFHNHNYWKVIMIGLLRKRGAVEEKTTEDRRRETAEERQPAEPQRVAMPEWVKEKIYDR